MFIQGWVISLLTFPGVIFHEFSHKKFCDLTKTTVYRVKYFQFFNKTAGYVVHEDPRDLKASFLITIGPLIVNTLICFFVPLLGFFLGGLSTNIGLFLIWIGLSAGMHAFPSDVDAESFEEKVSRTQIRGAIYSFSKFFSGLVKLANVLRIIWFDLWFAIVIATILPNMILNTNIHATELLLTPSTTETNPEAIKLKEELTTLKTNLDQCKSDLEKKNQEIDLINSRMDSLDRQGLVNQYNALVPEQNNLVNESNALKTKCQAQIDEYNRKVDQYNKLTE